MEGQARSRRSQAHGKLTRCWGSWTWNTVSYRLNNYISRLRRKHHVPCRSHAGDEVVQVSVVLLGTGGNDEQRPMYNDWCFSLDRLMVDSDIGGGVQRGNYRMKEVRLWLLLFAQLYRAEQLHPAD